MNKIILSGRLTEEPGIGATSTGKTVATFTLAVDRPFAAKDGKKEADFINIVAWNKTAELCGNWLDKGSRVLVEGRLQIRSYDGKDGKKKYVTEVISDRVEFIDRKNSGQQSGQKNDPGPMGSFGSEMQFDEEVPF